MADYSSAFSPSFKAQTFTTTEIPGVNYSAASNLNLSNIDFAKANSLTFNPTAFSGESLLPTKQSPGWTFITAPEDISWDIANQSNRVDIFGTNNPPVVAGTKGMRDLSMGNSLAEGFLRGVTVEGKIAALENLMKYNETLSDGFVSVPVYQVWANSKAYGNGYFIIKDVRVKETMRDLKGNSTRATVDISFTEVPAYQVNSGRDLASKPAAAAKALALPDAKATKTQQAAAQGASVKNNVDKGVNATNRSGAAGPSPQTAKPPKGGTGAFSLDII